MSWEGGLARWTPFHAGQLGLAAAIVYIEPGAGGSTVEGGLKTAGKRAFLRNLVSLQFERPKPLASKARVEDGSRETCRVCDSSPELDARVHACSANGDVL